MAASAKCSHGSLNRCGELRAVVVVVHVVVRMSTYAFDDLRDITNTSTIHDHWLPGVRDGADHQDDTGGQWAD